MLEHTTLNVENLDRSIEFYSGVLGLPVISRFPGLGKLEIAMLGEDGHAHLELIGSGRPAQEHAGSGVTVGFLVEDAEAIIAKLGVPAKGPVSPNPAIRFFFIQDPDGYNVQLLEHIK